MNGFKFLAVILLVTQKYCIAEDRDICEVCACDSDLKRVDCSYLGISEVPPGMPNDTQLL